MNNIYEKYFNQGLLISGSFDTTPPPSPFDYIILFCTVTTIRKKKSIERTLNALKLMMQYKLLKV